MAPKDFNYLLLICDNLDLRQLLKNSVGEFIKGSYRHTKILYTTSVYYPAH